MILYLTYWFPAEQRALIPFTGLVPTMVLLCVSVVGTSVTRGPVWALAGEWLSAPSAAAGLAMINAIGTGCGFFCNLFMGSINQATHSYPLTMLPIVGFGAKATLILLVIGRPQRVTVPVAAR